MLPPRQLASSIQLLVEGNDQRNFFGGLVEHMELPDFQIRNFSGVDELDNFLNLMVKMPGFHAVKMLGVVRDAETSAGGAFQSVQSSLRNAGLPVPDRPGERAGAAPAVNVLILPGEQSSGMLETLLCRTFANTAVDRCIDDFFKCFEEAGVRIQNPDKARARAFLATRPSPQVSVGVAAKKGYWGNLDHDVFRGIRQFLSSLEKDRHRMADSG